MSSSFNSLFEDLDSNEHYNYKKWKGNNSFMCSGKIFVG